jgi:predicted nucleotidyltransferase
VAALIFSFPSEVFYIREIERRIGLSTTAISSGVKELERAGIVRVERTALTTDIRADLESASYQLHKRLYNIYVLHNSGLVDGLVSLFNNPEAIVVFGSFANGEDSEQSDVDILVVSSQKSDRGVGKLSALYGKVIKRTINVVVLDSLVKSGPAFRNSIANGIVLHGYAKLI